MIENYENQEIRAIWGDPHCFLAESTIKKINILIAAQLVNFATTGNHICWNSRCVGSLKQQLQLVLVVRTEVPWMIFCARQPTNSARNFDSRLRFMRHRLNGEVRQGLLAAEAEPASQT